MGGTASQTREIASPASAAATDRPAVLVSAADSHVLAANGRACALLGWSRVELLLLGMSDLGLSSLTLSRIYAEADEQGSSGGTGLLRHRKGAPVPVQYQVTRIELSDEPVYHWLARRQSSSRLASGDPQRRRKARALRLSDRELEIVQLIADGRGNTDIAAELSISLETVKTHIRRLLGKLRARGRAHAVAIAWRENLLD
jgi:DNA-binding CsgD family transcriptional regulator